MHNDSSDLCTTLYYLYPAQLHVRGSTLHIANMYEIYLHCRHRAHILFHTLIQCMQIVMYASRLYFSRFIHNNNKRQTCVKNCSISVLIIHSFASIIARILARPWGYVRCFISTSWGASYRGCFSFSALVPGFTRLLSSFSVTAMTTGAFWRSWRPPGSMAPR